MYKTISDNPNIKNIFRIDINDDDLSNPKNIFNYLRSLYGIATQKDNYPHFMYALPANQGEREKLGKSLYDEGVH
ncbi:MAG: hypothetical protein HYR76_04230 [Ignavibacteria bacterium]|nr:hypothetical protein [Ignavibacteria bacterium]